MEKQGSYWGPILKNCPLGMTDKLIMLKMVHSCAFSLTCVNFSMILSTNLNHAHSKFIRLTALALTALTNSVIQVCISYLA